MTETRNDAREIRRHLWNTLADSPFLMIGLTGDGHHSEPMTAQLDPDADSAFWIYTSKTNRIANGGAAMAQFVSKGQDLFACIRGRLVIETDRAVIDRHWSDRVAAWFDGGRDDPHLRMLRFDLDDAEIWEHDRSILGAFRLLTVRQTGRDDALRHAEVAL
ncbi:MAG: pyridoxamine 5'-phosphate oxidase family protein [Pseudomonadota bacterium]